MLSVFKLKQVIACLSFLLVCVFGMGAAVTAHAETYTEGVHYKRLVKDVRTLDSSKIEVMEFFGYWCPHCNTLERHLKPWQRKLADDVYFAHTPVVFRANQEDLAKAYYLSQTLGVQAQTHSALFSLIHRQNQEINNSSDLQRFFANYGVSAEDFEKAYKSFSLAGQLRQGDKRARDAQISVVPTLVVNGKYQITSEMAGSQRNMLKVADYLIGLEREVK